MKVPLLDLKIQYQALQPQIDAAVAEVMASQMFILGPKVEAFERECAAYCGARFSVGVTSGTDAILMALMAEGIGPGDEVLMPSYTFFATAGCVVRLGALPVFVDIDPLTFNIDLAQAAARITPRTRAVIPVHLFGRCLDMDPLLAMAEKHNLAVIEDACQAIGAEDKGRRAGSMGRYGCFSFFPSKNLGAFGDAGLITTNDEALAQHLRILRNHGMAPKYYHKTVGGNFRLDALQAAVLSVKLPHLDGWTAARQRNADRYARLFQAAGLVGGPVRLPALDVPGGRHVVNQYVIRAERREDLRAWLTEQGVGTEVYYPVPLHVQECFRDLGYVEGSLPESEKAARETLALPIYPDVTDDQAAWVVEAIAAFYRTGAARKV